MAPQVKVTVAPHDLATLKQSNYDLGLAKLEDSSVVVAIHSGNLGPHNVIQAPHTGPFRVVWRHGLEVGKHAAPGEDFIVEVNGDVTLLYEDGNWVIA